MATFKERFNRLFEESELSQEDFGKKICASKAQIFNWRNGRGEPDSEMMKLIAKTYSVSVSWLLGESDFRGVLALSVCDNVEQEVAQLSCQIQSFSERDRAEIKQFVKFKEYQSKTK